MNFVLLGKSMINTSRCINLGPGIFSFRKRILKSYFFFSLGMKNLNACVLNLKEKINRSKLFREVRTIYDWDDDCYWICVLTNTNINFITADRETSFKHSFLGNSIISSHILQFLNLQSVKNNNKKRTFFLIPIQIILEKWNLYLYQ